MKYTFLSYNYSRFVSFINDYCPYKNLTTSKAAILFLHCVQFWNLGGASHLSPAPTSGQSLISTTPLLVLGVSPGWACSRQCLAFPWSQRLILEYRWAKVDQSRTNPANCQRFAEEISDSMDLHVMPGYFCWETQMETEPKINHWYQSINGSSAFGERQFFLKRECPELWRVLSTSCSSNWEHQKVTPHISSYLWVRWFLLYLWEISLNLVSP